MRLCIVATQTEHLQAGGADISPNGNFRTVIPALPLNSRHLRLSRTPKQPGLKLSVRRSINGRSACQEVFYSGDRSTGSGGT